MPIPALLGIDVATSGCGAGVSTTMGGPLASHSVAYPISRPQSRWAEQEAEWYWDAAVDAIRTALTSVSPSFAIQSIGICGRSPTVRSDAEYLPNAAVFDLYDPLHGSFRDMYLVLQLLFPRLANDMPHGQV